MVSFAAYNLENMVFTVIVWLDLACHHCFPDVFQSAAHNLFWLNHKLTVQVYELIVVILAIQHIKYLLTCQSTQLSLFLSELLDFLRKHLSLRFVTTF